MQATPIPRKSLQFLPSTTSIFCQLLQVIELRRFENKRVQSKTLAFKSHNNVFRWIPPLREPQKQTMTHQCGGGAQNHIHGPFINHSAVTSKTMHFTQNPLLTGLQRIRFRKPLTKGGRGGRNKEMIMFK